MKAGVVALWLPLGYTAGYLTLLLFVAAPLRRLGAYTISDFAEARLGSPRLRLLSRLVILGIVGFYLVPAAQGRGAHDARRGPGAPYWVGVVRSALWWPRSGSGGMRGITYVQAFQFWIKTFAIALPAVLLLIYLGGLPQRGVLFGTRSRARRRGGLTVKLDDAHDADVPGAATYRLVAPARAAADRCTCGRGGRRCRRTVVPDAEGTGADAARSGRGPADRVGRELAAVGLLAAARDVLGTMGLPHIVIRFYTSRDGTSARRTTVRVLGLLAVFYAFPGGLRRARPRAHAASCTRRAGPTRWCCSCPRRRGRGRGRDARRAAGGRRVRRLPVDRVGPDGVAGGDAVERPVVARAAPTARRAACASGSRRALGVVPPVVLALVAREPRHLGAGRAGRSRSPPRTFCPLLLLGVWWSRLTARGATAGVVCGALLATGAIFAGLVVRQRAARPARGAHRSGRVRGDGGGLADRPPPRRGLGDARAARPRRPGSLTTVAQMRWLAAVSLLLSYSHCITRT